MGASQRQAKFRGTMRAEMLACVRRLSQLLARQDFAANQDNGPFADLTCALRGYNGRALAVNLTNVLLANLGKPACTCHGGRSSAPTRSAAAGRPCNCAAVVGPGKKAVNVVTPISAAAGIALTPDPPMGEPLQTGLAVLSPLVFPPNAVVGPGKIPLTELTMIPVRTWPCSPEYGKWCGNCRTSFPGDPPIDAVDGVCKEHDICLHLHGHRCDCDAAFLRGMIRAVRAAGVSAKGRAYGLAAIAGLSVKPCYCTKMLFGQPFNVWGFGGRCPF